MFLSNFGPNIKKILLSNFIALKNILVKLMNLSHQNLVSLKNNPTWSNFMILCSVLCWKNICFPISIKNCKNFFQNFVHYFYHNLWRRKIIIRDLKSSLKTTSDDMWADIQSKLSILGQNGSRRHVGNSRPVLKNWLKISVRR